MFSFLLALSKAEKESEAINLLDQLTENALRQNKYVCVCVCVCTCIYTYMYI